MRVITLIPFLVSALPFANAAKTVYIDSTCTTRPEWNHIWAEVKQMAQSTVELFDNRERANRASFKWIVLQAFKINLDESAYQTPIRDVFRDIAQLQINDDYKASLIRIYCDGGKVLPDNAPLTYAPSPDGRLQWKKYGRQPRLYDLVNQMYRLDPTCGDRDLGITEGGEAGGTLDGPYFDPRQYGHHDERLVVTICDRAWQTIQKTFHSTIDNRDFRITMPQRMTDPIKYVEDETKAFNYEQATIDVFDYLPAKVIFHELVHAVTDNVKDDTDGDYSYGWANILRIANPRNLENADNYAMVALWVLAQDLLGLTLQENDIRPEFRDVKEATERLISWIGYGRMRSSNRKDHIIQKKPLIVVDPPKAV